MVAAASSKAVPPNDGAATASAACRPEHGFYAFDTLYCSLTRAQPIKPAFTDDKLYVSHFPPKPQLIPLQSTLRDVEHAQVQCEWEWHLEHTSPWLYRHLRLTAAPHCA